MIGIILASSLSVAYFSMVLISSLSWDIPVLPTAIERFEKGHFVFANNVLDLDAKPPDCPYFVVYVGSKLRMLNKCLFKNWMRVIHPLKLCVVTDSLLFDLERIVHIIPNLRDVLALPSVNCSHRLLDFHENATVDSYWSLVHLADLYRIVYSSRLNAMYFDSDTMLFKQFHEDRIVTGKCAGSPQVGEIHNHMFNISNTKMVYELMRRICPRFIPKGWGSIGPNFFRAAYEDEFRDSGDIRKRICSKHYCCHELYHYAFLKLTPYKMSVLRKCVAYHFGGSHLQELGKLGDRWKEALPGTTMEGALKLAEIDVDRCNFPVLTFEQFRRQHPDINI